MAPTSRVGVQTPSPLLVRIRLLNMVNDEDVNGSSLRFKFQSELILNRRDEVIIRIPSYLYPIVPRQASFVHNRTIYRVCDEPVY